MPWAGRTAHRQATPHRVLPYATMVAVQKTIIVAEDEPLVRMLAAEVLAEAGFRVIEAAHSDEALAALEQLVGDVHLLFTDVHMPGSALNGVELAHLVRARWPKVALLVTSSAAGWSAADLPEGGRFVPKPYELPSIVGYAQHLTAE